MLRSNLLVSIPLSILSLSPNGPEVINLFLHSSYVSTMPPRFRFPFKLSTLFFSRIRNAHYSLCILLDRQRDEMSFLWGEVRQKGMKQVWQIKREITIIPACVSAAALLNKCTYHSVCMWMYAWVYVVVTKGLMAGVAGLINWMLMNLSWWSRMAYKFSLSHSFQCFHVLLTSVSHLFFCVCLQSPLFPLFAQNSQPHTFSLIWLHLCLQSLASTLPCCLSSV